MSNHPSVGAVTATLEALLQAAANEAVDSVEVRVGAPIAKLAEDGKALVNLFLYRVTPNAAQRNAHMPSRDSSGERRRRSRIALDLHYLLSFYGDGKNYEPERLLGAVALALEDVPALTSEAIAAAVAGSNAIKGSTLAKDRNAIRIQPEPMSLEDFSKLWSVLFQVPYALSAAYICSHVELETQDRPGAPLPIADRLLFVAPISGLTIDSAGPPPGAVGPLVWGGTLRLAGTGLGRIGNSVVIDGVVTTPDPDDLDGSGITLELTDALFGGTTPGAGMHVAQVLAPVPDGVPAHLRRTSNAMGFALHPKVELPAGAVDITSGAAALRAGKLTVDFAPPIRLGQRVTVQLDSRDASKPFSAILDPEELDPGDYPAPSLEFAFADLPRLPYLVRADVDGFGSFPELGTDPNQPSYGRIVGPVADLS